MKVGGMVDGNDELKKCNNNLLILERQKHILTNNNNKLINDNQDLKIEIEKLFKDNQDLKIEIEKLFKDNQDLKSKLKNCEQGDFTTCMDELKLLRNKVINYKSINKSYIDRWLNIILINIVNFEKNNSVSNDTRLFFTEIMTFVEEYIRLNDNILENVK